MILEFPPTEPDGHPLIARPISICIHRSAADLDGACFGLAGGIGVVVMTTNACIESLCNHRAALDLHIRGAAACAAANADAAASLCHHICIVFDGDILGIPSLSAADARGISSAPRIHIGVSCNGDILCLVMRTSTISTPASDPCALFPTPNCGQAPPQGVILRAHLP